MDNTAYEKWLQKSETRDFVIRQYDRYEVRSEPNGNYKAQTALSPSKGTLSLYVQSEYIGSYSIDIILKAMDVALLLDVDINFPIVIKGLLDTIKQRVK